jgi:hypothetical protein
MSDTLHEDKCFYIVDSTKRYFADRQQRKGNPFLRFHDNDKGFTSSTATSRPTTINQKRSYVSIAAMVYADAPPLLLCTYIAAFVVCIICKPCVTTAVVTKLIFALTFWS